MSERWEVWALCRPNPPGHPEPVESLVGRLDGYAQAVECGRATMASNKALYIRTRVCPAFTIQSVYNLEG